MRGHAKQQAQEKNAAKQAPGARWCGEGGDGAGGNGIDETTHLMLFGAL